MKRPASGTKSSKKPKTMVAKKTVKSFGAPSKSLRLYKTGFPKQMFITHKYTQTSSLQWTTPNANIVYWNFGVNCLFDPYLSVGGTQPLYFDQLAAIYSHYTVMKSRIKVTMIPNTVEPFVGGICVDDDSLLAVTELQVLAQQPSSVYLTSQRDAEIVRLYHSWDATKAFGPNPLDNDDLRGDVSANPVETQAFMVFARPVNQAGVTTVFDIMVTIEFDTVWTELRTMTGS